MLSAPSGLAASLIVAASAIDIALMVRLLFCAGKVGEIKTLLTGPSIRIAPAHSYTDNVAAIHRLPELLNGSGSCNCPQCRR